MRTFFQSRNRVGFTLLEMLVGLIIFSIGILGFVSMMMVTIRGNRGARNTNEMATLVQSKIESLSGVCWDYLGTDAASPSDNGRAAGVIDMQGPFNRLGQLNGIGTGPYIYTQYTVVCQNGFDINKGTTPQYCGPEVTAAADNRPPQLACDDDPPGSPPLNPPEFVDITTREKMLRTMISWRDSDGKCRWKATDSLAFDWDGPAEVCPAMP